MIQALIKLNDAKAKLGGGPLTGFRQKAGLTPVPLNDPLKGFQGVNRDVRPFKSMLFNHIK